MMFSLSPVGILSVESTFDEVCETVFDGSTEISFDGSLDIVVSGN